MADLLTWTCEACGDERPDDRIEVRKRTLFAAESPTGTEWTRTVNCCTDREGCRRVATVIADGWWEETRVKRETITVRGGFRSRARVQHVRFRALALWRWRDYWRAATEAEWEGVEYADEARVRPPGEWRWHRRR